MIKDVLEAISLAARKLIANWGTLVILLALYVALLAVIYTFFAIIREATELEVVLTVFVLPIVALILFFSLQVMGLSYTRVGVGGGYLMKRALMNCWKLLLVSLPLFAVAWLIVHFVNFSTSEPAPVASLARTVWRIITFGVWYLLLCFALPLLAIHLWMASAREGVGRAFLGIKRSIVTAFSPSSVLVYLLVGGVFGMAAYTLFFIQIHIKNEWGELWLFGVRVALGLLMVFAGWFITLGAMAELAVRRVMGELNT